MGWIVKKINDSSKAPLERVRIDLSSPLEIKRSFSLGVDVNERDENGQTLLHQAAVENDDESRFSSIELLLKSGGDVNALDNFGRTPLHWLALRANVKIVQLLLDFGADVNIENKIGWIPLIDAFRKNSNVAVVKLLMEHCSIYLDSKLVQDYMFTPLHWACGSSNVEMVKYFVKSGANVNDTCTDGYTPLMINLLGRTDPRVVQSLLKCLDFNVIDSKGNTLMDYEIEDHELIEGVLEIIAKHQALKLPLHPKIRSTISSNKRYSDYYEKCLEELDVAKSIKFNDSWVTYFDLLIHSKKKLKNYAGNTALVQDFNLRWKEFGVYGDLMSRRVNKGIKMRELFYESAVVLSDYLPILNPTHLIVRDTLDCLSFKDYALLVQKV